MHHSDVLIIGGGIVGLSTAYQIQQQKPGLQIVILEKQNDIALHQTGRNSGVLHSGIYYKPNSLKAKNCREGKLAMEAFCRETGVAYEICGKVIVATDEHELPALNNIFQRGQENGIACEWISKERLKEIEPHCRGIQAIHVKEAGIVDYAGVCQALRKTIETNGAEVHLNKTVHRIDNRSQEITVETQNTTFKSHQLINCAGLHSDKIAQLAGAEPDIQIIPFRGEYFDVHESAQHLCKNLIYPVPDPRFPFLGVHFTRMVLGGLECGPNAVLAFAREGYGRFDVNPQELWESLRFPGFRKLACKHWRMGSSEMLRSWSKQAFTKALQRLIPEIKASDLTPAPSGIRAQAVFRDGNLADDFIIQEDKNCIHLCNAPSPAATAALNIGQYVTKKLLHKL